MLRLMTICQVAVCAAILTGDGSAKAAPAYPFYAFQNGMVGIPLEQQAKLLKDLGYDGMELNGVIEHVPEMLKSLDAQGLKMFAVYTNANVDRDKPPYSPGLKKAIEQLKGRGTILSIYVLGGEPSSSASDDRAVEVIRELADMAEASDLRVALYPHVGMYVARVEDGIRLAKKVDRKNVGVGFNLCHFLKLDDEKSLERRMREAAPYLFNVSINGADGGATNAMEWSHLIQTLDRGTLDVGRVLRTLKELGYKGPVGLQCYAIPGDPRENLKRSIEAWRKLCERNGVDR
jgi:sugar phosphate isomerase/epimerase